MTQLVEHRTGIAGITGSNPVEALSFFRLLSNCLDVFIKQHDGKLLLIGNLKQADVADLNIQDCFTKEVIEIW